MEVITHILLHLSSSNMDFTGIFYLRILLIFHLKCLKSKPPILIDKRDHMPLKLILQAKISDLLGRDLANLVIPLMGMSTC